MEKLLQKIPTLRITIAYATGIIAASILEFNLWIITLLAIAVYLMVVLLLRKYRYSLEAIVGALIGALFFLIGILFYQHNNRTPTFSENGTFSAVVLEKPEEKANSYKTVLRINTFIAGDTAAQANEKIIAYFEKKEPVRQLNPGSVILFTKTPQPVSNNGNPHEFDYKTYLARQKIYRQVYLSEDFWTTTDISVKSPAIVAETLRERLLNLYRKQNLGENETAILSALTLGYKRGLDPETKRVFSAAGAMHVLAVSGLHVGIIFGMFVVLLGFLKRSKKGRIIFVSLSLLLLWSYAIITGLSPSVMRAATMFSLVSIATNLNRRANIYNTLATSAFILLLINPNNLFEVGFQLSYSAVFGIVFLQPKLEKLWPVKNKMVRYIWILITVSISAQIATFPLTSYYFHQFPTYFLLTNIVVIPAVFVLIILGVLLLLFSGLPYLPTAIAFVTKELISGLYQLLQSIDSLPHSVISTTLDGYQSGALILALLYCFAFIEFLHIKSLKYSLLSLSTLVLISAQQKFRQHQQKELIVYNNRDNLTLQFINGRETYIVTEQPPDSSTYARQMVQNVVLKKKLHQPKYLQATESYEDKWFWMKDDIICFDGKTVLIKSPNKKTAGNVSPDFLVVNDFFVPTEYENDSNTMIITTRFLKANYFNIHSLPTSGAYRIQWE
ncbi:ComEC/Rec2 family competence protein [Maribellus sp. YY47]|uniref:ComEC/Rec2 family competence protein n=1 Tax=Maribellus sp. YY47 TaxID=2929486 RepID=UPI002000B1D5|nr:ComEC/Rec2 family competence protein [Maribellus sp. YY47]MCK3685643.1 competence protein ComEC family protein [Maribellus sp. YY47]